MKALASLLLVVACGCTCGDDAAPAAPPPLPVAAQPPPAPPPVAPKPQGLQPAAAPIFSTAVPEGFVREPTPVNAAGPDQPWVHVRGSAPLEAVVDFYTRYLDPGTPSPIGVPGPDGEEAEAPRCKSWAVMVRPDCAPGQTGCVEHRCAEQEGGLTVFAKQHPKPPGEPQALVTVEITTIGGVVRVTIENETLMQIVRENQPQDLPPTQDLTKYRSMEEIPPEFIE
jgi:hypothetical protein